MSNIAIQQNHNSTISLPANDLVVVIEISIDYH